MFWASSVMTQLMIANPSFDSLKFGNNGHAYDRAGQMLCITFISLRELTQADLLSVLSIVPVANLAVRYLRSASVEMVGQLGTIIGNTVVELSFVRFADEEHMIALLSKCPNLKSVKIGCRVAFNVNIVTALSNSCKVLRNFETEHTNYASSSVIVKLLTSCRGLTDIKLGRLNCITASMLKAILNSGTVKTLSWVKRPLLAKEERALGGFRKLVKEKQLLPVPRVFMYHTHPY